MLETCTIPEISFIIFPRRDNLSRISVHAQIRMNFSLFALLLLSSWMNSSSRFFFMKISNDSCHCQFQREATLYVPFYVVSNELRGFFLFLMWKTSHSCLPSFFSLAWLLLLTLAKWFPSVHWRVLIIIANIPMTMETREKKKWIETQLFFYYSIQYDLFHHSSG